MPVDKPVPLEPRQHQILRALVNRAVQHKPQFDADLTEIAPRSMRAEVVGVETGRQHYLDVLDALGSR